MKPSIAFSQAGKLLIYLTILGACPLLLQGQATKKTATAPPPPPAKTTPPPAQKPTPPQPQQQPGTQQKPAVVNPPVVKPPVVKPPVVKPPVVKPPVVKPPVVKPTVVKPTVVNPPVPPGGTTETTREGHRLVKDKNGKVTAVLTKSGAEAHFSPSGRVTTIKTASGTTITRSAAGARTVVSERISGSGVHYKVVSAGPHQTYVERPFTYGGHEYVRRTYMRDGHQYVSVYRGYQYGGRTYYRYVPAYYYGPRFYGWANTRWSSPVYYSWGWYGAPWYTPYGYYFAPYASYPSAAFWLTDYLVAENLRAAYEAQAADNQPAVDSGQAAPVAENSQATLTPEIKQMIADEVQSQLTVEQAAAQTGSQGGSSAPDSQQPVQSTDEVPPALDPKFRVFVVTTSIDVQSDGQSCALSPGDVLERTGVTADKDDTVSVRVVRSQKTSCKMDSLSRVQIPDLQEMYNQFRGKLDDGVKALADNQGKKGLPSTTTAGIAVDNPALKGLPTAPDSVAVELKKQSDEANQAENEVQQAMRPSVGTTIGQ